MELVTEIIGDTHSYLVFFFFREQKLQQNEKQMFHNWYMDCIRGCVPLDSKLNVWAVIFYCFYKEIDGLLCWLI